MENTEISKINAAKEALKFIENNSIIGLGTGSTAKHFIYFLAEKIKNENLNLTCIATSKESEEYAKSLKIKIYELNEIYEKNKIIDISVDGADEVADDFSLIKGYGGALTREKIVETASKKFICIVDKTKISEKLDKKVPIEILPYAKNFVISKLKDFNANSIEIRKKNNNVFITDNGNIIIDVNFGKIEDPINLEKNLKLIPGVVEVGIFALRKPDVVIVGNKSYAEIRKIKI